MSANNPLIQIQWSLDNTVFKGVELLQSLIKSAAEDDVHAQVVMAFEALGSALLVSPERIGEGIDALSRSQQHKLSIGGKLKAIVGLNGLGIARIIRKRATQCVPAFLLVTSCKICFDDIEIGNILYEMLLQFGLMRTFPASRLQMGQLASSISGYGDDIIPTKTLETVADALSRTARGSATMAKIFWQADTKSVAEIFARTFGALLKDNIKRITLQGEVGGVFLASIFLWLLPDEFGLSLEGVLVLGQPDGKVILDLTSQEFDRWVIQEWQIQDTLQTVIVKSEDLFGYETSLVKFTGASSGLRVISTQFQLDNDHIEIVGQLATALIMTSYKYGVLSSDPETFSGSQQTVRLSEICQTGFLGNLPCCMAVFGWKCHEEFTNGVRQLSNAMDEWIASGCPSVVEPTHYPQISSSPGLYLYWVFDNLEAWMKTRPDYINIHLGYSGDVLDPAIFLAAEALYACVCDILPSYRSLRGCRPSTIHANAATLVALVFVPTQVKDTSKSPPKGVISNLSMMSVSEFRRLAIMSLVPGSPGNAEKRDLVFSFNGYVAFASPLQKISTIPRECVAISIVPGVIRWGEDNATFDRIRESRTYMSPNQTSERRLVEVFDHERIQYLGLEPRVDESSPEIESLISTSGKTLQLRTYIRPSQRQNRMAVEVDWLSSINAVAVSIQVDEQDMLPAAEEALANMWLKEYVWDRMTWVQAHGTVTGGQFGNVLSPQTELYNHLSMTYGNERLRFFLAGRCKGIKIYMRQGSTPLMQCVRAALAASQEERRELPTRQKSVVNSPAAKGEQSKTTTTLKLPSGISKSRNWIVIS